MKKIIALVVVAIGLSGCWTFSTTKYPSIETSKSPSDTNITVAVIGFSAILTEYRAATGFHTVFVPGGYGHRYYEPGHFETVQSQMYIPQLRKTDVFLSRAKERFERAGFSIGANSPDWTAEVEFSGPYMTSGDDWRQVGWQFCTLFFCDYATSAWSAKLRVRDNRTGKLMYSNDYSQRFETKVFALIPLFGISSCEETTIGFMQNWCLSALTDRAVADATAFLSQSK